MIKKVGILGSGFGLYGYLPCFSNNKYKVYTLLRYKKKILLRKDLRKYEKKINFVSDTNELLNISDIIVIAKRPSDQENLIKKIIKKKLFLKEYFFEKPFCSSPLKSIHYFNLLNKRKVKFRIGYLFLYTKFYKKFLKNKNKNLELIWKLKSFDLNKKKLTWKLSHRKGGGIIRFYAIHFFPLLSIIGKNWKITKSKIFTKKNFPISWEFECFFKLKKLSIYLDINSTSNNFKFKSSKKRIYKSCSPFGDIVNIRNQDYRIKFLKKLINDNRKKFLLKNYYNSLKIWKNIEDRTKIIKL